MIYRPSTLTSEPLCDASAQFGYITWTPYEVNGSPVNTVYEVYKDQDGNNNWSLYFTGTQTQVNDTAFGQYTRYRVVTTVASCSPTRSFTTISSNVIDRTTTGLSNVSADKFIQNLSDGNLYFPTTKKLTVYNLTGQIVFNGTTTHLWLDNGAYIIETDSGISRLIVQK